MSLAARLLPLALVALLAAPISAEPTAWDQARVTEIAGELASACNAFDQVVRREPGTIQGDEGAEFGVAGNARELREQSEVLAAHLRDGKGHDETRNLYRNLEEVVDDTEQNAQQSPLDEPVTDAWAKVADLMRQLAPYYE